MNHLYTSKFQVVNIAPSLLQNNGPATSDSSNLSPTLPSPPSTTSMSNTPTATSADSDKKRLTACLVCRKRKLKCDSARPKCASCARLGHAWFRSRFQMYLLTRVVATRRPERNPGPSKATSRSSNKNRRHSSSGLRSWKNSLPRITRNTNFLLHPLQTPMLTCPHRRGFPLLRLSP